MYESHIAVGQSGALIGLRGFVHDSFFGALPELAVPKPDKLQVEPGAPSTHQVLQGRAWLSRVRTELHD